MSPVHLNLGNGLNSRLNPLLTVTGCINFGATIGISSYGIMRSWTVAAGTSFFFEFGKEPVQVPITSDVERCKIRV